MWWLISIVRKVRKDIRIGLVFGFFGALLILIFLPLTAFITPGFTPLRDPISWLAHSNANSLYSFGLLMGGSLLIPFYIYLERVLLNIKKSVRIFTTSIAIFTNVCVALVGIPADPLNMEAFNAFHAFVTVVGFLGTSIHVVFYSIMMYKSSKSITSVGPIFKKYLVFSGIFSGVLFALFIITRYSIIEWIAGALIIFWVLITAVQGISFKFPKTEGGYYNKSQDPEVLQQEKDEIQIIEHLEKENSQ